MTRDHYKGSKKSRDAVIRPDGSISPLSNQEEPASIRTDALYTNMSDEPKSRVYIYARSTGSDENGDGSLENPYRTFFKCMDHVPLNADGRVFYFDISGIGLEVVDQTTVSFPPIVGGGGLYNVLTHPIQAFEDAGQNYFREGVINIVAAPTVLASFTPTSNVADPFTGNRTYTFTGAGWAPDEFKGKFLTNYSNFYAMFSVFSNTEDTITVAYDTVLPGELSVVEPSAILQYGSSTRPDHSTFTPSFDLAPCKASMVLFGIEFRAPAGVSTAVDFIVENLVQVTGCVFDGLFVRGHNFIEFNGIYTTPGKFVILGGPTVYVRNSHIDKPSYFDWGGGLTDGHILYNSQVEGCSPIPHLITEGTGTAYNGAPLTMVRSTIVSGTGNGIQVSSMGAVTLDRVHVKDCAGDGVHVAEGGSLSIRRTYGSGNTGYGAHAKNGGHIVIRDTATSIAGDLGDFKVGVLPADTWSNFNSGFKAVLDTTAVSGTLSRMHNPSAY